MNSNPVLCQDAKSRGLDRKNKDRNVPIEYICLVFFSSLTLLFSFALSKGKQRDFFLPPVPFPFPFPLSLISLSINESVPPSLSLSISSRQCLSFSLSPCTRAELSLTQHFPLKHASLSRALHRIRHRLARWSLARAMQQQHSSSPPPQEQHSPQESSSHFDDRTRRRS
jgi:hypothetical protein